MRGSKVALFLSTFTNKVDKKGRVSVPASFRAAMVGQGWAGIIAFPSFVNACVEGCDVTYMERLTQSIDQFAVFSEEHEAFVTWTLSKAHQLPFDSEGRIVLPQKLVEHAEIDGQVTFVGRGKTFQLWEPAAYEVFEAKQREIALRERGKLRLPPLIGGEVA
ncbi:MAG: division/cell wall cluster transcriptional repressor MraZ [Sphingomonadales bacterium]